MNDVLSSGPSPYAGLWKLDPQITFLNHGSFGACPRAILERQQEIRDAMEADPVRFMEWEYPLLLDSSRRKLALFTGCDPAQVVFTRSVTQAVNAVLRSFPFAEGDEIVSTDHEYNACANVARYLADGLPNVAAKVKFIEAKVPYPLTGPDEIIDAVMQCITPRTRLLLIDQVTSPSGFLQPVAELVEEMNRRGIETLVDGS
ncbi:MAG: aminotransferase class V-fold PLP-dependent enzyme, partial [Planctomycetia bacterium]|nr:aminotransferase class V-fold PLP-dependent enzyme [Planctomycetia bacterium]